MGALCSCPCRPSRSTRARDPAHESHVRLSLWAISRKPTYEVPPPTPELSAKNHEESVFSGVESPERHRDEDDDDDDEARALGEPSRRGAAQAAATRAMGQDLEHPRRRVLAALVLGGELRALPRGSSPSREADRRGERRGSHAADDRIVAGRRRLHAERRG